MVRKLDLITHMDAGRPRLLLLGLRTHEMMRIRRIRYPWFSTVVLAVAVFAVFFRINAQKPELVLQDAHNTDVAAVAISADKKLLATAGSANDVRVWDLESGVMLRSLPSPQVSR